MLMHRAVSETLQFRLRRLWRSSTCRHVNLHRLHTDQRTLCTPVISRSKTRRLLASGTFCGEETLGHTVSLLPMLLKVRPGEQHRAVAALQLLNAWYIVVFFSADADLLQVLTF